MRKLHCFIQQDKALPDRSGKGKKLSQSEISMVFQIFFVRVCYADDHLVCITAPCGALLLPSLPCPLPSFRFIPKLQPPAASPHASLYLWDIPQVLDSMEGEHTCKFKLILPYIACIACHGPASYTDGLLCRSAMDALSVLIDCQDAY